VDLNPIIRFELIRTARWRRHYQMRAALGLIPLYVIWVLYDWAYHESIVGGTQKSNFLWHLPQVADVIFLELTWWQGLAVVVMVPGLVAGSIAEEDRRGTMLHLLATPLSSGAIVLGKMTARLVHVGVALGAGLPFVVPLGLLGALDPLIVVYAYAILLALTLFAGSLSLLVSIIVRRASLAIPAAYLAVGGWLLLPVWYAPIVGRLGWPFSLFRVLNDGFLLCHPSEALWFLWRIPASALFYPPNLTWAWSKFLRTFPRVVGLQAACSVVFLLLAAVFLRPLRLGHWARHGYDLAVSSRPAVGDNPMLWKERHAPARLARTPVRLTAILVGVVLFWPLAAPAADAFRECRASWWDGTDGIWAREGLNESLRQLNAGLYVVAAIAVAAIAATSITGERERGTWTSLATTLVTGDEVTRAKVSGTLWAVRGLSVPFLILWSIGLATGSLHALGVLAAAAGLIIFARFASALGVLFSMLSSTSDRAIAAVLMALVACNAFALLFVPMDLIGPLAGTWQTIYLAGMTPMVEWVSLASPMEIQWWWQGKRWEAAIRLPWGLWGTRVMLNAGLVRTFVVSLALHAIGTIGLMRIAAWLFDCQRDAPVPLSRFRRGGRQL
jgi:hypothetical protein